jgi:hypothetical protein
MAPTAKIPWLKIEHTGDWYKVHWLVERQSGRTIVVDLGHSQSFATESEAQRWRAAFASALAEDERPLTPWRGPSR